MSAKQIIFYFFPSGEIGFGQCDRGLLKLRFRASFVFEWALILMSDFLKTMSPSTLLRLVLGL